MDQARAIIDAPGTWQNPNPLGASGLPAIGEATAVEFVSYGVADVLGADRASYASKRACHEGAGIRLHTRRQEIPERRQHRYGMSSGIGAVGPFNTSPRRYECQFRIFDNGC
jgi:hypothetical protein